MKIVIDMNLSPLWLSFFESNNIEAVHWSHIGPADAKDAVIMQWARTNDYIVFTHDLDFGAALALTKASGPSIIQIRTQDTMPDAVGDVIVAVIRQNEENLRRGSLIVIDEGRARVRILPL
jgi:predicted nuclease of predicted toxin-antitoxin system